MAWRSTPEMPTPPEIPPRSEADVYRILPFQKPRESMSLITILLNKTIKVYTLSSSMLTSI